MTTGELKTAEESIIRCVQKVAFKTEYDLLHKDVKIRGRAVPKTSSIYRLDPFMDPQSGLLKVGGRLSKACIEQPVMHPVLLPRKGHVSTLIIRDAHVKVAHAGRNHVMSKVREQYWVISTNSSVRRVLRQCVTCRKLRDPIMDQKMADLPADRVTPAPPFTNTGIDFFGPQIVKEGRKQLKRYGVLFTCLSSRAIHIETANSLDTSSFINALRRFVARRGNVRKIRCDNGTNFHGAERELRVALQEMSEDHIRDFTLKAGIDWSFNPPAASHMGGVWERQIRTVRKVLAPLLKEYGERLDDES